MPIYDSRNVSTILPNVFQKFDHAFDTLATFLKKCSQFLTLCFKPYASIFFTLLLGVLINSTSLAMFALLSFLMVPLCFHDPSKCLQQLTYILLRIMKDCKKVAYQLITCRVSRLSVEESSKYAIFSNEKPLKNSLYVCLSNMIMIHGNWIGSNWISLCLIRFGLLTTRFTTSIFKYIWSVFAFVNH